MFVENLRQFPKVKEFLRQKMRRLGIETADWIRIEMFRDCFRYIHEMGPEKLDALEISGGPQWKRDAKFKSYMSADYPEFDICTQVLPQQFDLIIADQVFEHLKHPHEAARNVYRMLRPGGTFIVSTPFLIRVHASPIDCNRWTETGLTCLLQRAGFPEDQITTNAWGNRACVKANFNKWAKAGPLSSMKNEPDFPVMVWAFARKSAGVSQPVTTNSSSSSWDSSSNSTRSPYGSDR